MSNPTTPFSWQMPTATDLVTDLPADFEVFGQAVATSMADLLGGTTGQILSKTTNADMDFTWITNDVGDITGITATSPLTGGGTSGAVTVGIQSASTSQSGAVQLSDSTSTTSSVLASTPTATKAAYDLAAAAVPKSTVTAKGSIFTATASATPAQIAVGNNGENLVADSSAATGLKWAAPAAMTLISTTTLSGATVTISSIPTTYKSLLAIITGVTNATADGTFRIDLAATGASNFYSGASFVQGGSPALMAGGYAYVNAGSTNVSRANANNQMTLRIDNYTDTTNPKAWSYYGGYVSTSGGQAGFVAGGYNTTAVAITSLIFSNTGGNLSTGTVKLYGVN